MSQADRQQYDPIVTELSEQELQAVFTVAEPPICLLGGWAVHLHATPKFENTHGRPYIGSRDIDLGVEIEPSWDASVIAEKPVAKTYSRICDELEYTPSRFGFVQQFHRDRQERLSNDEARQVAQHNLFEVYIDFLSSTPDLDAFEDAFGFRPPDEPLLQHVFDGDGSDALSKYVSWNAESGQIVKAPVLAAMKVRAFPERDKSHKQLKDIADLHTLLWYVSDYQEIVRETHCYLEQSDIQRFTDSVTDTLYMQSAQLINEDFETLQESVTQFLQSK